MRLVTAILMALSLTAVTGAATTAGDEALSAQTVTRDQPAPQSDASQTDNDGGLTSAGLGTIVFVLFLGGVSIGLIAVAAMALTNSKERTRT